MSKISKLDVNDPNLSDAMRAMEPGDMIEVEGCDGAITISVPALESEPPGLTQQERDDTGSWLD